jgi:hypothetical protein
MALAGLWENWRSPAGEWARSFAIITTTPNDLCAELHDRMHAPDSSDNNQSMHERGGDGGGGSDM